MIELRVLGPVEVGRADGSGAAALRGLAARLLLALAVDGGRPVGDDVLLERAWPAGPPLHAIASVRNQVGRLRRELGPLVIERTANGYRLNLAVCRLDADEFVGAIDAARAALGDPAAAIDLVDAALSSVRGRPYDDVADELWAMPAAAAAAEHVAAAEELWSVAMLAAGRAGDAVARLRRTAEAQPQREVRWWHLATALASTGRRAEGLREIGRARRSLAEFGLLLGPDLLALERELVGSAPDPADGGRIPVRRDPMVGRESELAAVLRPGPIVWVEGVPGSGKTRLLAELADRAAADDIVLYGACPPVRDAGARLLAALVAAAQAAAPGAGPVPDELVCAAERVPPADAVVGSAVSWLRQAGATHAITVVVDDVHRLDAPAVGVVRAIVAGTARTVRWVFTAAPAGTDSPAGPVRAELASTATVVRLGALTEDDVSELVGLAGPDLDAARRDRLVDEVMASTGGHAVFAAALVAHRLQEPDATTDPPGVDAIVAAWLADVPAAARDLVDLLALGGPCPLVVLGRLTAGDPGDVLELGERLERAGLAAPVSASALDLRHELIRRAAERRLTPAAQHGLRRRLLRELGRDDRFVVAFADQLLSCGDLLDDEFADERDRAVGAAIERLTDDARYVAARAMADRYVRVAATASGPHALGARLKAATAQIATGDVSGGRALLAQLIDEARRRDDQVVLADAILAMGPLTTGAREREDVIRDAERLTAALPAAEGRRRVQLACWAAHHRVNRGEAVGAAYLLRQAEEAALTAPDLGGLILAVRAQADTLVGSGPDPARRSLDELRAFARSNGDLAAEVACLLLGSRQAWVDGTVADVAAVGAAIARTATDLPRPDLRWWPLSLEAAIELATGRVAEATAAIEHAARAGRELGVEVAGSTAMAQHLLLLVATGEWTAATSAFEGLASAERASASLVSAFGLACAETGRFDAVVEVAARLARDPQLLVTAGMTWGQVVMCASEVAYAAQDVRLAELLWRSLEPYGGTGLALPAAGYFGAADRCLGLLAATLGDREQARSLLAAACVQERRRGAALWEARASANLRSVRTADTVVRFGSTA